MRVSIVGASGYVGSELVRLLDGHPEVELGSLVGHGKAGQPIASVLPAYGRPGAIESYDADVLAKNDAVFCALPHGASAPIVRDLRQRGVVVLDLSADFRIHDRAVYQQWYGEHPAPDMAAVYGLVELHREAIAGADLIAVPGCYPTATILALAPLLRAGLVSPSGIVVDAKSGVSGAGRTPLPSTHFPETAEGLRAYKIAGTHRHTPEIEQELSLAAGEAVKVLFTPHLVPMTRGILSTSYASPAKTLDARACTDAARALYRGSSSVIVLDEGACPDTSWTRGSNRAFVSYAYDARTERVIAQCALDNLVKGAAGQAVQCLNVRFGFREDTGIAGAAVWP